VSKLTVPITSVEHPWEIPAVELVKVHAQVAYLPTTWLACVLVAALQIIPMLMSILVIVVLLLAISQVLLLGQTIIPGLVFPVVIQLEFLMLYEIILHGNAFLNVHLTTTLISLQPIILYAVQSAFLIRMQTTVQEQVYVCIFVLFIPLDLVMPQTA